MVLPIFLGAINKTTYIQIHTTSYLKQLLKCSGARDNVTYGICNQQRPRSDCLLADMKQIDQTTKVIRHLAPLDDLFFFFFDLVYGPFKNISRISSRSFIKGECKPENPGKNYLTFRKQNLGFPHVTRARLEPQW